MRSVRGADPGSYSVSGNTVTLTVSSGETDWTTFVLPLDEGGIQYLWLIEKTPQGYRETCVQEANFVPLVSGMDV